MALPLRGAQTRRQNITVTKRETARAYLAGISIEAPSSGEIVRDLSDPGVACPRLFSIRVTDYRRDTVHANVVRAAAASLP
ncbi:hypothetical protein MMOR_34990 [Mycolicibacterium moriokaense]|jgi:hypothetical protein|uniref:Uncharacterized protein n=1 Tax=Mycolicibacterium moriokaense TaxID=39691 RepID=A0AAD1HBU5_9MYCO|nr:hypothetical protein MMOR_34990 [Mycolicibacterium moriokaense]